MPRQTLTVEVNCDTLLEPEVLRKCCFKAGDYRLTPHGDLIRHKTPTAFASPHLCVTPKEPEVSEPKYTIPVDVPREVYEKYSGGNIRKPLKNELFWSSHLNRVDHAKMDFVIDQMLVLTPRVQPYVFPKELRVPGVHSIAADDGWTWWVYCSQPVIHANTRWINRGATCRRWSDIGWLFPNVQMPTPEQCHNDWKQSLFVNPDWKEQ